MEEGLANEFWESLKVSNNPIIELLKLYFKMYDLPFNKSLIPQFGRLVKIYGVDIVFSSLLDMNEIPDVTHDRITNLINYLCKRRMENKINKTVKIDDLSEVTERVSKEIKKLGKVKLELKEPFSE